MQAWQLRQHGWKQRQIAIALGVTEAAVSKWVTMARDDGPVSLIARSRPGPAPRLEPDQMRLIPDFLGHGAEAYGFRGEVWTCARIAKVIEEEFGVSYNKGHVSRLMRDLHWTPSTPVASGQRRLNRGLRARGALTPPLREASL
jgi:transposase